MDQNLSGYKIFYEVANCGNISKAAKKLYISQPAISKSIVKLEDGLDTKLFHRNSRGVTLTEEGEVLFRYIRDAFENINSAETELKRMKEFNIGHILIGASTTMCRYELLPYLKRFMEQYPNIRVSICTQGSAQTLSLLEQRKVDIGLVAEPKTRKPEMRIVHSRQIHDVFVATPQYLDNLRAICGNDFNAGFIDMFLNFALDSFGDYRGGTSETSVIRHTIAGSIDIRRHVIRIDSDDITQGRITHQGKILFVVIHIEYSFGCIDYPPGNRNADFNRITEHIIDLLTVVVQRHDLQGDLL